MSDTISVENCTVENQIAAKLPTNIDGWQKNYGRENESEPSAKSKVNRPRRVAGFR